MRLAMRRHGIRILLAACLLVLLLGATPAFADQPTITRISVQRSFLLPRNPCSFPVWADLTGDGMSLDLVRYAGTEMYLSNVHGDARLTNTQNGKSVTLHLAEATQEEFLPDGSLHFQVSGATMLWAQPPKFAELTLLRGQREMYFDAAGNLVSEGVTGSLTNLCDVLAG